MTEIIEYNDSLAETLSEMWNQSREEWGGDGIKTPEQERSRHAGAAHINSYVAMAGNEAIGYCSLTRYWCDADTLYIDLLSVRPDFHGKKVGKALVLKCVERTIELGYARLDIHTWAGNTAAVPLYKKCGYLWEDRADSTHMQNFIPEILTTPLFADFFKKADWYGDSTRSLEITPDGVKVNGFEVFGYTWEKDGETLAIGYERTGRRMRLIETNDYKIELMAEAHSLAFGLKYNCAFKIQNKSAKPLHIKITGCEDKHIKFDYTHDEHITGEVELPAQFSVNEITEPQSKWKTHPCLLANVEINGQAVTFGLGIEAKFPLDVNMHDEVKIKQSGTEITTHIDIISALPQDAAVKFSFPQNSLLEFKENAFTANIPAKGKTSITTAVKILNIGYEALPMRYTITLKDGTEFIFEKPLHWWNQDLTHAFPCEGDYYYNIKNGPWQVSLSKQDNEAYINNLLNYQYSQGGFDPPQFGKPYDDEFNLIKPTVTTHQNGTDITMEAEYLSEKFPGMAITQIFTLNAAGIISRKSRIQNRSKTARSIMLNDSYSLSLGENTVFSYQGKITQNHCVPHSDGSNYGIESVNPDGVDENWIFEASPTHPKGFCWHPSLKPAYQWGDCAIFEIDMGELAPGQIFETHPVIYVYGIFTNYGDFRNYATQLWEKEDIIPAHRVEVCLNNYNPFIPAAKKEIKLEIINNREDPLEGEITASGICQPQTQTDNIFTLPFNPTAPIEILNVDMNLSTYVKSYNRALFPISGEITRTQDGSVLTADNGIITFKADPAYAPKCFSLTAYSHEWLLHQHPEHKPYAWWNPFLGGFGISPPNMNAAAILKEQSTADFAEITDNHGNTWQGIRTTLTIKEDEEQKGAVYESYFVTLPGIPILCAFHRFINNTGVYKNDVLNLSAAVKPSDDGIFFADFVNKDRCNSRLRFGTAYLNASFENTVKLHGERPQSLYIFHANKHNGKANQIDGDTKNAPHVGTYMEAPAANGKTFTTSPMFLIITEKDLPDGALDNLERIIFK